MVAAMLRPLSPVLLAVWWCLACSRGGEEKSRRDDSVDPVINYEADDPAMNKAIADARAHLSVFDAELARRAPGKQFSVKKPFPKADGGNEHMWLIDVKAIDGGFDGRLDNDPESVPTAKIGERYTVKRDELSDWMVIDDQGRMFGAYTVRVQLPEIPAEQRAALEAALQPLP